MSVETEVTYLTVSADDLRGMGACDQWQDAWESMFGDREVAITPAIVAQLLDENFPLDWFVSEANYHTETAADRRAGKAIALALIDDCRPLVAKHISETQARRLDDARQKVAALDIADHWNWWKVEVDCTLAAVGNNTAKEWLLYAPLSCATRAGDLCGLTTSVQDVVLFSSALIGKAVDVLPRTCAAIAAFGADNIPEIRRRIADLAEQNDDDDDDDYYDRYDEDDDEDTEEDVEEDEDDGDGADLDQPAP